MADSHLQAKAPKRAFGIWSPGETAALVEAWAPLHIRRRGGQGDVWVPLHQRGRPRRALVAEDWRAVAAAVNAYRADNGLGNHHRTPEQCKQRVKYLRDKDGDKLLMRPRPTGATAAVATRGSAVTVMDEGCAAVVGADVDAVVMDDAGFGAVENAPGGAAAEGPVAIDEDFPAAAAAAVALDSTAAVGVGSEGPRGRVAMREGFAAAWDVPRAAAIDRLLGGHVPKRPRTGCSSSVGAAAGGAYSVKEELVQQENARHGAGNDRAAVDGLRAALEGMLNGAAGASARRSGVSATDTAAAVVMRMAGMCEQVMMKSLDVDRERDAAAAHKRLQRGAMEPAAAISLHLAVYPATFCEFGKTFGEFLAFLCSEFGKTFGEPVSARS